MATLGYGTVGSNRLEEAKSFYDALLGSAGITPLFEHPSGGRVYGKDGNLTFRALGPYDRKSASVGNGSMFAFRFDTRTKWTPFTPRPSRSVARTKALRANVPPRCTSRTSAISTATSFALSAQAGETA